MQKRFLYLITIMSVLFGANLFISEIAAQTRPFTMRQILNALSTMKQATGKQKRDLSDKIVSDVERRKVDFKLTKENEKLLRAKGATNEILAAIRENLDDISTWTSEDHFNNGYYMHGRGAYDYAIAEYTKAISLNPKYVDAYLERAIAYSDKGDSAKAITDYTKVLEIEPKNRQAYLNRGEVYYYKGEYDKAIADYTKIIEINPNDDVGYYYRGNVYYKKGDYDRAIADYRTALKIDPNYKLAKDSLDRALKKKQQR